MYDSYGVPNCGCCPLQSILFTLDSKRKYSDDTFPQPPILASKVLRYFERFIFTFKHIYDLSSKYLNLNESILWTKTH